MKQITKIVLTLVAIMALAVPAESQVRFGLKAGLNLNKLHLSRRLGDDLVNSDNRVGFTGGIIMEVVLPVAGLGIDASALYAHRSDQLSTYSNSEVIKRDYICVPVNLKYKLTLPVIGRVIKPFATTGPEFQFLIKDNFKDIGNIIEGKNMSVSWNVGFGIELLSRVQVHASYGIGLSKALKTVGIGNIDTDKYQNGGKDNYWTVTAAYLF